MRLFRRIGDIISANLNEMIDRFEDPETMLKQAVREMEQAVDEALDAAVQAVAGEKLLARQLSESERQAERWRQRAAQYVAAGDDDQARALPRKLQQEKLAAALADQHQTAEQASARLRRQIDGMRAKLAEAKRRLAALLARKRAAQAQRMLGNGQPAALSRFERCFQQLDAAEAEAEAYDELTGLDDVELFEDDETVAVEAELAALKREAGD